MFPERRAPSLKRTNDGPSEHGQGRPSPFKSAYVVAKHRLIAICPGYVLTPLAEAQIDDQAEAHWISRDTVVRDVVVARQPNKRFATVEEMGALTAFLCGPYAASITGAAFAAH